MTEQMMADYQKLKAETDKLRWGVPAEKRPKSPAAVAVWKEAINERTEKMAAIAKRLTYDEKKALGILSAQAALGAGNER